MAENDSTSLSMTSMFPESMMVCDVGYQVGSSLKLLTASSQDLKVYDPVVSPVAGNKPGDLS